MSDLDLLNQKLQSLGEGTKLAIELPKDKLLELSPKFIETMNKYRIKDFGLGMTPDEADRKIILSVDCTDEVADNVATDLGGQLLSETADYYNLVQFDGTEPDAQGFYNSMLDFNRYSLTGVSGRKARREVRKTRKMRKREVNESTEASSIATKMPGSQIKVSCVKLKRKSPRRYVVES